MVKEDVPPTSPVSSPELPAITRSVDSRTALLIIVTYNSFGALAEVIDAIVAFEADNQKNHVVVVENSSDSRVEESIRKHVQSERVLVEVALRNDGFSHGVNLGFKLAGDRWGKFDYITLVNPDVVSAGRVVCELVNRAARDFDTDVGLWGVVLKDESGRVDLGCARRVWNRRRFFSQIVGYPDLVKALRTAPRCLTLSEIESDQSDLSNVSGAFMCIAATIFGAGVNCDLPMYFEDQEVGMRCLKMGYKVHLFSDLEATHLGGSSRKSVTDSEHALRIMELIEAPVQCMVKCQGYGLRCLRLTVLLGGAFRFAAVPIAAAWRLFSRHSDFYDEVEWMSEQRQLSQWFMRWAIRGKFHDAEVSLTEYFSEYEFGGHS